jgi:hypothetical protein
MPFKKGISGNPEGRPKGCKNKPIRAKIESLIKRNITRIEKEIDTITPEQRRDFLISLSAALSFNQVEGGNDATCRFLLSHEKFQ